MDAQKKVNDKVMNELLTITKEKKDRKEYFKKRYQAKKQWYQEWHLQRKSQQLKVEKDQFARFSQVNNYKVLMSLKEYTQLTAEKKKKWLNFVWIFQDLQENGIHDVVEIMKLREEADNLIRDYYATAKHEEKIRGRVWNSLDEEQQQKLINYWASEKVRKDKELVTEWESQAIKDYEVEIEMKKFHEERGKVKCKCWQCQEVKKVSKDV